MKKVSNWPEFHFKEVTSYKICISIHNFFLSLDSSHEPTKGTDGKPIGKKEAGREWKLPIFPIEESFYQKIMNNPQINHMVPMSYIHARWQLPIQVGRCLIIIRGVHAVSDYKKRSYKNRCWFLVNFKNQTVFI